MFSSEFHWKETHMVLKCDLEKGFDVAKLAVLKSRFILETYIKNHPNFKFALEIDRTDPDAPEFIKKMMDAGIKAGVGPMASVAGGISEEATEAMIFNKCSSAMVENGGDISIKGKKEVKIGIFAGGKETAEKTGFRIKPEELPLGICTSAGNVGPSISFGNADAVVVFSKSAFLSDAAATAIGNIVKINDPEGSIQNALEKAESIDGVMGCLVFIDKLVGKTGNLPEMVEVIDIDL